MASCAFVDYTNGLYERTFRIYFDSSRIPWLFIHRMRCTQFIFVFEEWIIGQNIKLFDLIYVVFRCIVCERKARVNQRKRKE